MTEEELMREILRIADMPFTYAEFSGGRLWLADHRHHDVNPYHYQTEQGLFLGVEYEVPVFIATPWGKYEFVGSSSGLWDDIIQTMIQRLNGELVQHALYTASSEIPALFTIRSVDGLRLPQPKMRDLKKYLSCEIAMKEWRRLVGKVRR